MKISPQYSDLWMQVEFNSGFTGCGEVIYCVSFWSLSRMNPQNDLGVGSEVSQSALTGRFVVFSTLIKTYLAAERVAQVKL